MPKETVYGSMLPFEEGQGRSVVQVRWDREAGDCSIVTKAVSSLDGGRLVDEEGVHYTDGFHVQLDRRGMNTLIRDLRRARDQAFGRDE